MKGTIIEGRDLSRMIGVREDELQQMASRMQLPFNFSTMAGFYIRRENLRQWEIAANAYRGER
jgi:hypothetical protein